MKNKCTDVIDRDKETSPSKNGISSLLSWTRVLIWERDKKNCLNPKLKRVACNLIQRKFLRISVLHTKEHYNYLQLRYRLSIHKISESVSVSKGPFGVQPYIEIHSSTKHKSTIILFSLEF
jgi:hypothetical protein